VVLGLRWRRQGYFCTTPGIAVCTSVLANDKEANTVRRLGGPSFCSDGNEFLLFGNNTFGGTPRGAISGSSAPTSAAC
jgi:hypothetical protein